MPCRDENVSIWINKLVEYAKICANFLQTQKLPLDEWGCRKTRILILGGKPFGGDKKSRQKLRNI